MKQNIGVLDKIVRGVLGLGCVYVAANTYTNMRGLSITFFVFGFIFIITSTTGFCPAYKLFGTRTKKENIGEESISRVDS